MPDGARGSIFAVLLIIRMTFLALNVGPDADVSDVLAVCIAGPLEHFALHLVK